MREPKDLKPLKPLKYPGDPDPSKQKIICQFCGSTMASPDAQSDKPASTICPNCNQSNTGKITGLYNHQRDEKGKQFNPYSIHNPMLIQKDRALNAATNTDVLIAKKKKPIKVKDEFVSEEIKQCLNKRKSNEIIDKEDVMRSCVDLAIDG